MRQLVLILMISLSATAVTWAGQKVELGTIGDDIRVTVEESNELRTVIRFDIGAFTKEPVDIDGSQYYKIACGKEGILLNQGEPALPRICRSIIIPDDARMKINVLSSEYIDIPEIQVVPSKGNLYRDVNPDDVPYTFGDVYSSNEWYPSTLANIREPHILRDFRGTVVEIYPFNYNPILKTLRVYKTIIVEVAKAGSGEVNVLDRRVSFSKVMPEFERIYKERFINYNFGVLLYTPVREEGSMLIITYDNFHDEMIPFANWKMQKGIRTAIVDVSTIGNTSSLISNFIQDYYDSTELGWVLLVGDAAQVATPYAHGGASDPSYAKVAGNDNYPDIFIGRFSAENINHVQTQVLRTIAYESNPVGGDWFHMGVGIASNQGPGHYGEDDDEHMDLIRNDLLNYNYTEVDQIYDPYANSSMVTNALNAGRSIVNYCGHGSNTSWLTTGFSNSHVNALVNDNKLPFIISVACVNGNFNGLTCFAEAWLRATHNGNPTGAIATYMSSINQSWNPPMYAQDEAVDLLCDESMVTFGGICYNGSCYMIDVEGSNGVEMYDTWHIFGDPSLQLWTDTPAEMTVYHENAIIFTATEFDVEVVGIENALCALYSEGIIYGSAYTDADGMATISIVEPLPMGETITLTITAYNHTPYIFEILVITPNGPYILYDGHTINDTNGNNNGEVDFSENIFLGIQLVNVGPDLAYDVVGFLSTADTLITITGDSASFGEIEGDNGVVYLADAFAFDVSPDIPDGHVIDFELEVTDSTDSTWISNFTIPVHAPDIGLISLLIDDSSGNGNGILEAGETADVILTLINNGSVEVNNVAGTISEYDSLITIVDPSGTFGTLGPYGGQGDNSNDVYTVMADSSFPQGYSVTFDLSITADGGLTADLQFILRTAESFEYGNGGYSGTGDWEWGEPTSGPQEAFYGVNVWATNLEGDYGTNRRDYLTTPQIVINSPDAQLEFYHWYDFENYYDGGNVSASTNGGLTWNLIYPENGYPSSYIYSLGQPGYSNNNGDWSQEVFDIGEFFGDSIIIRWKFASDGYTNKAGWYIDDVAIIGNSPLEPPSISVDPVSFDILVETGSSETRSLTILNNGNGPAYFYLTCQTEVIPLLANDDLKSQIAVPISIAQTPAGAINKAPEPIGYHPTSDKSGTVIEPIFASVDRDQGGPDEFGYVWIDSDEPGGPEYNWVDITSNGTEITGLGRDTNVGPFNIGFNFDFYGNTFNTFQFCTNGFVSFTSTVSNHLNRPIPTSGVEPLNLLAPLWDDLNFSSGGEAYYYTNNSDSLIVSWVDVPHYSSGGPYTFQMILLGNGNIYFQYLDISSPLNSTSVGIQNGDGSIGLQVTYNANYLQNYLAIEFTTSPDWLIAEPVRGIIEEHSSFEGSVTFDASYLDVGSYTGNINLISNDPDNPEITIPVTFEVAEVGIADISFSQSVIRDTLSQGEISVHEIVVFNNGTGVLDIDFVCENSWIEIDNEYLTIAPGNQDTLLVTLNTEDLDIGNYSGAIDFLCNDPDTPVGTIYVMLRVIEGYVCEYVPGDINGDGNLIGGDVTYGVLYFRGIGDPPPDSCYHDSVGYWLYVAGDANGDCLFIGSDITYLVSYFRGVNPSPAYCPFLPPSNPEPQAITITPENPSAISIVKEKSVEKTKQLININK